MATCLHGQDPERCETCYAEDAGVVDPLPLWEELSLLEARDPKVHAAGDAWRRLCQAVRERLGWEER